MKNSVIALILGILTCAAAQSQVAPSAGSDGRIQNQVEINRLLAPIKSAQDLYDYLNKKPPESPLDKLSPSAKRRFVDSLQFNEKGLTTFQYTDLESELSTSEIYQVLALFGVQHHAASIRGARVSSATDLLIKNSLLVCDPSFAAQGIRAATTGICIDYPDYQCIKRGTCESAGGKICTSNC
ncbi:hypothetical protein [Roseateles sp. YR242]|uniref:hypothetical protein n=1 Tax=Roseateles sp. YR242 TaxID=1855305 RepID=UPI0011602F81|nr:hypothetical protein [Roseateles sp. YR242]